MKIKRIIQMVMAIAIISLSLAFVNPVRAYTFYSEHGGAASTTIEWDSPKVVGEYTTKVLKLGVNVQGYLHLHRGFTKPLRGSSLPSTKH